MAERRLDSLTSLRFFACLLVVLYHSGRGLSAGVPGLSTILASGDLGVGFFFVLSGFVLAVVYAPRLAARPLDRRKFFVARFARIYPLYLATILVAAVPWVERLGQSGAPTTTHFAKALLLRLTLLSAWVPGYAMVLNTPAWTLSVEAFFYALFPFVLVAFRRAKPGTRRAWVAITIAASLLVPLTIGPFDRGIDLYHPLNTALFLPPLHLGAFLAGIERGLVYLERDFAPVQARRGLGFAALVSLVLLAALVAFRNRFFPVPDATLAIVPFSFVILYVAVEDASLAFLRLPPLVLLGEASYGAYLLQEPVFVISLRIERWLGLPATYRDALSLLAYLLSLGLLSIASLRLFETPARRWLRARFEPKGSVESRTAALGIANEPSGES